MITNTYARRCDFPQMSSKMSVTCMLVFVVIGIVKVIAAVSDENSLKFVMLGDWGGQESPPYYTDAEKKIAEQMGSVAESIGAQFTVALGDNFYSHGVTDVNDPRFQTTFENVFTASSLMKTWYVVLGNHDHKGNASAEIAYTKVSDRWYLPDYYYTENFTIPGTNSVVQFVFIDTVILAGMTDSLLRHLPPSGPTSIEAAEKEWQWIEDTLRTSTAQWLFVCGHYPVWSVAEHGPTEILVSRLRPLLSKYQVSAYFCGHDHDIQHIREQNDTVNYFVSGAGHLTNSSVANEDKIPPNSLLYRYGPTDPTDSHGGFNSVSISQNVMTVTFYNTAGNTIYNTTITSSRRNLQIK